MSKFYESRLASEEIYDGRLLKVFRDRVRLPDGRESVREYIRHPGAAVILALDEGNEIVLVRQFRYPLGQSFVELPAGKIDPGEDALACAKRELEEETGYRAGRWQYLMALYPCIGYADERLSFFLARDLTRAPATPDHDEFVEVFTLPFAQALDWVKQGLICDAKTVAGLLWLDKQRSADWTPGLGP